MHAYHLFSKINLKKANEKIEMLFIDEDKRGNGIGSALVEYAKTKFNVNKVIVNETNYMLIIFI